MWLMCFIMDRCLSIQSGKAWMVQEDAVSVVLAVLVVARASEDYSSLISTHTVPLLHRPSATPGRGCGTTSTTTSATAT